MPIDQSAAELLQAMQADLDTWVEGDDIALEEKYSQRIAAVGVAAFFSALFRTYEDSRLSGYLLALLFAWRDVPFAAWKEVLCEISEDSTAVYQFVWFARHYLGIDVVSMIRTDPGVKEEARLLAERQFPGGGPSAPHAWTRNLLRDNGLDQELLWRRLADEGAPMKLDAPHGG